MALLSNVPAGEYMVQAGPVGKIEARVIQVSPNEVRQITVPLRWPATEIMVVSSLRGRFRNQAPGYPLETLQKTIHLLDSTSRRIATAVTQAGSFDFGFREPGLYFIEISSEVKVAVEVAKNTFTEAISIVIDKVGCGASYRFDTKCPMPEFWLQSIEGNVFDFRANPLANGMVSLGHKYRPPDRSLTGIEGGFSRNLLSGNWDLEIRVPGFVPAAARLHIDPSFDGRGLSAWLDPSGGCGRLTVH